jgi:nitrite reductase/ring-hydroxylating ferredoxin subunit
MQADPPSGDSPSAAGPGPGADPGGKGAAGAVPVPARAPAPVPGWEDVGDAVGLAVGGLRRVVVAGGAVALGRTEVGYFALEDACPHAGAPLSAGMIRGEHVVCSWHGWKFECATGVCPLFPGAPSAARRDVRVEGGRLLVGAVVK